MDIPRTFPDLAFFTPGGGLDEELRKVLEAYVCYRPDVGYVQGMSFLGAVLVGLDFVGVCVFECGLSCSLYFVLSLSLSPLPCPPPPPPSRQLLNANDSATAFKCLCALLGRHVYMDFFRFDVRSEQSES